MQTLRHTADIYLVGATIEDARQAFPFFDLDQAADYASDHGGQVFIAEAEICIDPESVHLDV